MLNHIDIMGRLARDPELRKTQSGISVASFCVAVERDFQAQDGSRETDFIDCVAWRNTGEFIAKYFKKGSLIAVSGRLEMRKWFDREGNKRVSAEIVVDSAYFGGSSKAGQDGSQDSSQSKEPAAPALYTGPVEDGYSFLDEEDPNLPFSM